MGTLILSSTGWRWEVGMDQGKKIIEEIPIKQSPGSEGKAGSQRTEGKERNRN